jgi:hypothetical protein
MRKKTFLEEQIDLALRDAETSYYNNPGYNSLAQSGQIPCENCASERSRI